MGVAANSQGSAITFDCGCSPEEKKQNAACLEKDSQDCQYTWSKWSKCPSCKKPGDPETYSSKIMNVTQQPKGNG